jgi:hypothetical protein
MSNYGPYKSGNHLIQIALNDNALKVFKTLPPEVQESAARDMYRAFTDKGLTDVVITDSDETPLFQTKNFPGIGMLDTEPALTTAQNKDADTPIVGTEKNAPIAPKPSSTPTAMPKIGP